MTDKQQKNKHRKEKKYNGGRRKQLISAENRQRKLEGKDGEKK